MTLPQRLAAAIRRQPGTPPDEPAETERLRAAVARLDALHLASAAQVEQLRELLAGRDKEIAHLRKLVSEMRRDLNAAERRARTAEDHAATLEMRTQRGRAETELARALETLAKQERWLAGCREKHGGNVAPGAGWVTADEIYKDGYDTGYAHGHNAGRLVAASEPEPATSDPFSVCPFCREPTAGPLASCEQEECQRQEAAIAAAMSGQGTRR